MSTDTQPKRQTPTEMIAGKIAKQTLPGTAYVMAEDHLRRALNTNTEDAINAVKTLLPNPKRWECNTTGGKVSFRLIQE